MKVCICIPTFNRYDCIEHLLNCYSPYFERDDNFDIFISDTSSDERVVPMLEMFKEEYPGRIAYDHYDDYPDTTTDLKVYNSFEKIVDEYNYVYLCGDGLIVDIQEFIEIIHRYGEGTNKYDLIHFNPYINDSCVKYISGKRFLQECGWFSTYYGATVISTELLRRIEYINYVDKFRNTGFMYWEGLISEIASEQEKIIAINHSPTNPNPYKGVNSSYQPKKFINFWVVNWNYVIDALPEYYDDVKAFVKKDIGNRLGLYRIHNLLILRNTQNLDFTDVMDKKDLFEAVANTPFGVISFISKLPLGVSRALEHMIKGMKKLLRR